jgi:signal transduction histidine kinase
VVAQRRRDQIGYDSAFGVPDVEVLPRSVETASSSFRYVEDSRVDLHVESHFVALAIRTPPLLAQIKAALADRDVALGGPDIVPQAALVIAEAGSDIAADLADLRHRARQDTAILLVLGVVSAEAVARAHLAGAFACLRPPLVREELLGLVTAALDSRNARIHAADLTRKLDLESHLASIGRMSAGLSHEVSSPLGAAALNMETVQRECARLIQAIKWLAEAPPADLPRRLEITRPHIAAFESPEGLTGAIEDTIAAHDRLRSLFTTMQGLIGRSHHVRRERIDLLKFLGEVRKWLTEELLGVEVEVIGEPLGALADRTLLGQLLQNLISNAAHAAKSLSTPRVRLHAYPRAGRVVISVRDNGPGIPPDLQERIFEPFFTTRRGQGGTGLGLALCREYARELQAELSVWSVPGRGACFRLNLPSA